MYFKKKNGRKKLNIIYHISLVGGNFYQENKYFGVRQGIDKNTTCFVTLDMPQLHGRPSNVVIQNIQDYIGIE